MSKISVSLLLCLWACFCAGQQADTTAGAAPGLPQQFLPAMEKQAQSLNQRIVSDSRRYLQRLATADAKLVQRLRATDPEVAAHLPAARYEQLLQPVTGASATTRTYVAHLDSLSTTVKYLAHLQQGGSLPGLSTEKLTAVSGQLSQLQNRIDQSTLVEQYITQRREQLCQYLTRYSQLPADVTKLFTRLKTTGYYYRQQVEDWKAALGDSKRLEAKTLRTLGQLPSYQQFLAKHSMLASLFAVPAGYGDSAALSGLQTKDMVGQQLQHLAGSGGQATVAAQVQQAYGEVQRMQDNVARLGNAGQQVDMPHFQPNTQSTKTFLGRLTYGVNLQVTSSRSYLPTTGVLGGQLGYKITDHASAGIGLAYNMGVSGNIGHLHFSSQGISLRSYGEIRVKNSWYASGGYELNYFSAFNNIAQLRQYNAWQPAALIGIEKKYRLSSKMSGQVQLLFDALYRNHVPAGQPFVFRTGYSFK